MHCFGNVECEFGHLWLVSACMRKRMSSILAQASKARLGENSRTSSLIVFERLAQASVSRLSENPWELCSSAWAPHSGG